ncbi:Proton extrusion protein PcxA [Frankliniella fusca]|uniref:Proton extrusion protein PcxA n=1 Tax=Frankliniella fusca TaxID=407009 RepID=A0AAE1LQJ2_9NEOP|nr:Proton extrusion protein PcxA [Frankliniella fusca]
MREAGRRAQDSRIPRSCSPASAPRSDMPRTAMPRAPRGGGDSRGHSRLTPASYDTLAKDPTVLRGHFTVSSGQLR